MKTLVLIGMTGVGKTTTGKILAEKTGLKFKDFDDLIEEFAGKTISEIFEQDGERYFRKLEAEIIKYNYDKYNIISLGGGAFENIQTQKLLLSNTNVIYLQANISTLENRLKNNTNTRPLLKNTSLSEKLSKMLQIREKNYKLAQYKIITDNKIAKHIAEEILKCVNWK